MSNYMYMVCAELFEVEAHGRWRSMAKTNKISTPLPMPIFKKKGESLFKLT
jgi:hypothetical protein